VVSSSHRRTCAKSAAVRPRYGSTRCSNAGAGWCAATHLRSASVSSSSSHTNGRPAAHTVRKHRLPVQPGRWLIVGVRPFDDRQVGKAQPWCDHLVRLAHPGSRPDQRTVQRQQPAAVLRVKPVQQWIAAGAFQVGTYAARTTAARHGSGPQRDEETVDVKEHEPTLRQAGHQRHRTDAGSVQRPTRISTLRKRAPRGM